MKKISVLALMTVTIIIFANCHSAKKAAASMPKYTYENNIQSLVMDNCSPCHIPSKGGNKKALDTYDGAKANIDDMIRRISLNPEDKGFMPFKHPKLSEGTINVFKQWKEQGTPQQ